MIMYIRPAISLEEKTIQKLMFEPAVDSSKIKVACENGKVILFGSVNSLFEKSVVERAVRSIQGVEEVVNELQVNLTEKNKKTDIDIASAAIHALKWNVAVPEDAIQVTVEDGNVTLTGTVDWWYQRHNAEKAILNLIGVKSVTNLITIFSAVTPKEVKEKIMEEFHRNASIDAEKINIEVDGSTVILKGTVRTWPEMTEALRAAWSITGVTKVDNQLIIYVD